MQLKNQTTRSYYHSHETAYQQIKSNGYIGWGNAKDISELGDHSTNKYLLEKIEKYFPETNEMLALDLGCGTGTTAFIFAKLGFITTGIDISETAIEIGAKLAIEQNLKIKFITGDVLNSEAISKKYNLIYDSHLLHCIVFQDERKQLLSTIRKVISGNGIFILDTMVMPKNRSHFADSFAPLRFDENYILWHKTRPSNDIGVFEFEGQHWCAQRRIYPSDIVIKEVIEAGFEIIEQQIDDQENSPSMLRMILK